MNLIGFEIKNTDLADVTDLFLADFMIYRV